MDAQEYQRAIVAVAMAAGLLAEYDLEKHLRSVQTAMELGPILDPTLFRKKEQAAREDAELIEAALPLWRLGRRLKELRKL